jgi:uncharacterized protein (TIGR02246 family)
MKRTLLTIAFLLLGNAVLIAAEASADFKAAVQAAAKDFPAALTAKDAARVGMMYTKDAIAFPPNSEMVTGREAIQAFWKGIIDAGMTITLEPVNMDGGGDLGVEAGKYKILAAGKEVDQGKYVVVWKKEDGTWKLYRDIWNTSMPAPAAP